MRGSRIRNLKVKLAVLCTAGTLFQAVSCTQTSDTLFSSLVQSIVSVFITDFVNRTLGVTPLGF